MAKAAPIQLGFSGGKLGPRMYGRPDVGRYKFGCREMTNFIPTVQGPALKRSGTRFLKVVADETKKSRLIPFEFSRDQAYVIELAEGEIRFIRDSGGVLEASQSIVGSPTAANPCSVEVTAHGYSTGDEVFITGSSLEMINDQFFTITVTGVNTFTLGVNSTGETTGTGGTVARTYQITDGVSSNSIPWLEADLDKIQYAQDADVMYLAHPSYPPHKLSRTSDTSWTCEQVVFQWPPFREENITETTVYASASTGATVTIQASADIFTADMVGSYIRIGELAESTHPKWVADSSMNTEYAGNVSVGDRVQYEGNVYELDNKNGQANTGTIPPIHDDPGQIEKDRAPSETAFEWKFINRGAGYGKIETFTDANTIVVDVDNWGVPFPNSVVGATRATKKWSIGAFDDEHGYPSAVAFYEQRLWFGGTEADPQTFWGSRTNRYEDFQIRDGDAASGLKYTVAGRSVNGIQWMTGEDVLILGTNGVEFTAQSTSENEGITPDNVKVKQRSAFGSAPGVAPRFIDSALLMIHRSKRRMHELIYDFDSDRYAGVDLTSMSHDIMQDGAVGVEYQASPFRQVFVHTTDGRLVSMTYDRAEDVVGWFEYELGNAAGGAAGIVESVAVIPHPDGDQDQVWLAVRRTIGGNTRRFIEYLEKPFEQDDAIADAFFVDAGITYSGSATTLIYGALHLAGAVVNVLNNGTATTASVSTTGAVAVSSTTKAHIGFIYDAELETMDLDVSNPPMYTVQGDRGRVVSTVIRVDNTGAGVQYGQSLTGTLDTWSFDSGVSLYTGDSPEFTLPGGFSRSRRVAIKHSTPLPCTIVSLMPVMSTEGG